jgi:hypothetical protein
MGELKEQLDKYTEELFDDLELEDLPEERQADLFARVEEHLRDVIIAETQGELTHAEQEDLRGAFDRQNYKAVEKILERYPSKRAVLERKIEMELKKLRNTIVEEQQNVS